jgi:hypothetical protein
MLKFSIKSFKNTSFLYLRNFETVVLNQTVYYYVPDLHNDCIIIFDENWNYLNHTAFSSPYFIKKATDNFYISNNVGIYKTDMNLIAVSSYNTTGYRSIYYNSTDKTVIAINIGGTINYFNENLTLSESLNLGISSPIGINFYNGKLYIINNSINKSITVLQNKQIINSYSFNCNKTVAKSAIIDHFGYMAWTCSDNNTAELNYSNGTFTQTIYLNIADTLGFLFIDLKGRFIVSSTTCIYIFY